MTARTVECEPYCGQGFTVGHVLLLVGSGHLGLHGCKSLYPDYGGKLNISRGYQLSVCYCLLVAAQLHQANWNARPREVKGLFQGHWFHVRESELIPLLPDFQFNATSSVSFTGSFQKWELMWETFTNSTGSQFPSVITPPQQLAPPIWYTQTCMHTYIHTKSHVHTLINVI